MTAGTIAISDKARFTLLRDDVGTRVTGTGVWFSVDVGARIGGARVGLSVDVGARIGGAGDGLSVDVGARVTGAGVTHEGGMQEAGNPQDLGRGQTTPSKRHPN